MMPHLSKIYDDDFFAKWSRHHADYVESSSIVTDVLFDLFAPKKLIDIGCGCGVYGHHFMQKGVKVTSLDGVRVSPEYAYQIPVDIVDLTRPFENTWGDFDVALCLEVAEHIPEEFVDIFLNNITQFSSRLLLSAAPPHQGGHHHVNEQPRRYWIRKLAPLGFTYSRPKTGQIINTIREQKPPYSWMGSQISLYERSA